MGPGFESLRTDRGQLVIAAPFYLPYSHFSLPLRNQCIVVEPFSFVPMNIAFDAKRITNNRTGLGNYSRYIVRILAQHYASDKYLLLSPSVGSPALYSDMLQQHPNLSLELPDSFAGRRLKSFWRNYAMRSRLERFGAELYHGLSNEIPMGLYKPRRGLKTIVTIHDLAFVRHPEFYKPIDRFLYRRKYGASARHASHVIAVSLATKRDIIDCFGIPEERVSVLYQGCSPAFARVAPEDALSVRKAYSLPARYMLFVGSIEERKNLKLAVRALAMLQDRDIALVAVGRSTPYCRAVHEEAARLGVSDRLLVLHNVETAALPGMYLRAELFVYPSRFEGFGIPLLEALNAGVPVIGATGSCLEEAGGPSSLYTHPDDPEMLAALMERVLASPETRHRMVVEGRKYAQNFEDARLAQQLHQLYQNVLQEC